MQPNDVHDRVSNDYARALERARSGGSGCCGGSGCGTGRDPVTVAATLASYGEEQRERYADAATTSFGCGNPLAFTEVRAGERVLDLGSGAGFDLLLAAEAVGPEGQVIGVDMTDAMIDAARANAAAAGFENIDVRKGLIEQLPVDDGSVDWVISNCVINLSPDKGAVFAEIARVLAPGGRFSVSDIVAENLPEWIREDAAAHSACVAGAISEQEYLGGLVAAGLTDVRVTERLVYDLPSLRAMVASDLVSRGLNPDRLEAALAGAQGKVASVKVVGRRPAE